MNWKLKEAHQGYIEVDEELRCTHDVDKNKIFSAVGIYDGPY
jgi:hypothetical protein